MKNEKYKIDPIGFNTFAASLLFMALAALMIFGLFACSSQVSIEKNPSRLPETNISPADLAALRAQYDTDGDGLSDDVDPCPATSLNDQDGDGVCEAILSDLNGDGCVNLSDQSILGSSLGQKGEDLPADIIPDGIVDLSDVALFGQENGQCQDNCPSTANPEQLDADKDGVGDLCEALGCESNFCSDNGLSEGYHCNGDQSIRCGSDASTGCLVEELRTNCSNGCQIEGAEEGLCMAPPEDPTSPQILSINGTSTNGGTIGLSGSNLGTHTLDLSSSVGPNGWIERNANNTRVNELENAPGWGKGFSNNFPAYIDSSFSRTGSKSINASVDKNLDNDWQKPVSFYKSSGFDKAYVTWWVYFQPIDIGDFVQWKRWYISPENHHSVCSSITATSSLGLNPTHINFFQTSFECTQPFRTCYLEVEPEPFYEPNFGDPWQYRLHNRATTVPYLENFHKIGGWTRVEIFVDASDLNANNGRYEYYVTKENEPHHHVDTLKNLRTHDSSCTRSGDPRNPWRHFGLHGYFDDNGSAFAKEVGDIFYDDVYIQFGTKAHLELGNYPSYEDSTQLEIQTPKTWSSEQIELELNYGKFSPGETVYLFVVREDGKVSAGHPITLE